MNRFPLAGKTAVVTGGAGGIGFAIASRFAHEGASVVLAGRTQSKLHASLAQLQEIKPWTPPQPQAHSTHCFDVRTPRGWASLVEAHVRLLSYFANPLFCSNSVSPSIWARMRDGI